MSFELFRKSAADKYLRTDTPGALLTVTPPSTVALFGALAFVLVALVLVAAFGRAQVVAEGRGVLYPDQPSIAVRAPFSGRVVSLPQVRASGREGDALVVMDARDEEREHARCAGSVAADETELDALVRRLADWNTATGQTKDAATALVLITQVRAQREKLTSEQQRCEALGTRVVASRIRCPATGTVTDIVVSPGAQVREGDLLLTLVPASAALVGYVALPESDRGTLSEGQSVLVKFDALPFTEVGAGTARVTHLLDALPSGLKLDAPAGSSAFAEVTVLSMPTASSRARPGMTFTADVLTHSVPVYALVFDTQ